MTKKAAIAFSCVALFSGIMLSSALAAEPIKIGILLPLTGRQASFGRVQEKAVLMAADEINAGGGIKSRKIRLIIADTQGNPDAGRAAIRKLINRDRVLVVGGGFSNAATWAAISIAQKNKTSFLINSAAADKITEQGWEYIFRLNQPVSERLDGLISFISAVANNSRSVAIVHANSLQASASARTFFRKTGELGLNPVFRERIEVGVEDLRPLLRRAKEKSPDLIYAVTDNASSAALLVGQSKGLNLNPKVFIGGGDGFVQPEFAVRAGKASDYIICTARWGSGLSYPPAGKFHDRFIARFKTPPGHNAAEAYAGISVIADALKRSKALAREKVRDALSDTNLKTVLGPVKFISYNNKSQQNKLPAFLVQWFDGQAEIVWPKHLATKKYVYPMPQ